jgi:16S rRNA (cytosine967-C5)-methyltransferase
VVRICKLGSNLAKHSSVSPARLAAFTILQRVDEGAFASILLAAGAEKLSAVDRSLTHELVLGVLRWQLWLDRLMEQYSTRKSGSLDLPIRLILRLGLYQLRFLSRVPASAVVNESVELVKLARLRSATGLVNAVLRNATRNPNVDPASAIDDPIERLAIATSHPAWLIERWTNCFGAEQAEAFARSNNEPAVVAFRVVKTRASENDVVKRLREAGADLTPSKIAAGAWRITGTTKLLTKLAAQGEIYIQDEASQLVAQFADVKAGETMLDLCAAPGSKTTQIAGNADDAALVIACDLHSYRLRALRSSAKLQDLHSIRLITLDGLQPLPFMSNVFNCVLVDAPCSGTGTLRHNPEIRWRISSADIFDLSRRQIQLLLNTAATIKPGGRLVYSTCAVEREENEDVRELFLEKRNDFVPIKIDSPEHLITEQNTVRTWPHRDGTDGFFIAAFERKRY